MSRPSGPEASGERSVAAERIDGVVVTGDDATITVVIGGPGGFRLEVLGTSAAPEGEAPPPLRSPSYLLGARRRIVPYRSRPIEQQALTAWRDGPARASVVLLHGPGGQGKSRLAGWLATDSHRREWTVAQAVDRDAPTGTPAGMGRAPGPLLVVVDYAERWAHEMLVRLVETVASRPDRVRVLLLARPLGGFWDGIEPELERCDVEIVEPVAVNGFTGEGERAVAFAEAVEAFQKAQRMAVSPVVAPPGGLGPDDSPLSVQMAALAAVTANEQHEPPPAAEGFSLYLLNHERRHWRAAGHPQETGGAMVLVAAVFGPATSLKQAREWLRAARLADTDAEASSLLAAYERLYPAASGQAGRALWPIRPDRFAEDLIGDQLEHPRNAEILSELLTDGHVPPMAVRQGLITLAAAARHASVQAVLFPLLRERAELATHLTAPLIDAVIRYADTATAEAVDDRMPWFSTDLLRPARDLAHHLLSTLPPDATPAQRAHRLFWLGIRLTHAGDTRAALDPTREATGIYRRLTETEPATYLSNLAWALDNLGLRLTDVGDKQAALEATREATGIYRRLTETEPTTYLPRLADVLTSLGFGLADVGDKRAALEATREAIQIRRRLAETDPETDLSGLATCLGSLGIRLADVGDKQAALDPAREAADIYRRLTETEPAPYLPDLANALNNLGIFLANVGDRRAALEATREAADIYRRLTETEPAPYLPDLAKALNNLGIRLTDVGDNGAALEATREAVQIRRRLAETDPTTDLPDLAMFLNNLGTRLANVGDRRAALELTREAVDIYRRLAETEPAPYLLDLAMCLHNLGIRLAEAGDKRAALEPAREAADVYRQVAETEPATYLPYLAGVLDNLGGRLSETGDKRAALELSREAVDIYRRLAETEPAAYLPNLAIFLNNLGIRLAEAGDKRAALEPAREAVDIYRRLAETEPAPYLPGLAGALSNLGLHISKVGDERAALELTREGVDIHRRLAETEPAAYLPDLAMSLRANASIRNVHGIETDVALTSVNEAIEIYQKLSEDLPDAFDEDLRKARRLRQQLLEQPDRRP